jgi:hypothetical protein
LLQSDITSRRSYFAENLANTTPAALDADSASSIAFQRCFFVMDGYQQKACQRLVAEKSELSRLETPEESVLRIKLDAGSLLSIHVAPPDLDSLILISLACSLLLLFILDHRQSGQQLRHR